MYSNILVPLDGSKASEAVLTHVALLAKKCGSRVMLVHIEPHSRIANMADDATRWQLTNRDAAGEEYLDQVAVSMRKEGISVSTNVFEGHASDVILEQAVAMNADLIALSTHGVAGLGGILLSGIAGRILHHSTVPLLLVKPDSESFRNT